MSKTARSWRASPSEAGSEQRLAILPWRLSLALSQETNLFRLLLVAGGAIAAGSNKPMRYRIGFTRNARGMIPARVQNYRRMPSFSIKPL
jgi:hypothetical protein